MSKDKRPRLRDADVARAFDHGELMTVREVAALLHRSARTVRTMCRIGRLEGVWNGPLEKRLMGISRQSVENFISRGKSARRGVRA